MIVAFLLLVAWIVTLGLSVNHAATYYPEGIATDEGVTLLFDVETRETRFGIPLFFTYHYDRLPYDVQITASSADLGLKSIHVREVEIKYDDSNQFITAVTDVAEPFTPVMYPDRASDAVTGAIFFLIRHPPEPGFRSPGSSPAAVQ